MATKKTGKLFAYETFMDQARKEGRVRNETLSMKVLKPDLSLQARVNHIDKDHVRALHEILKNGRADSREFNLAPIIVFEVGVGKYKIADGFHRHEVYKREGEPGIPCTIVTGTLQEAIEYAASCNQKLSLRRTREDAKKAVFMLLENGWLNRSRLQISRHAGVSAMTAANYTAEFCRLRGEKEPQVKQWADGRAVSLHRKKMFVPPIRLAADVVKSKPADDRIAHLEEQARSKIRILSRSSDTKEELRKRGIYFDTKTTGSLTHIAGGRVEGFAVAMLPDDQEFASRFANSIASAIGRVLVFAEHYRLSKKVILVPYVHTSFKELTAIASRLGIEFMTLDQFVEAVKADEAVAV